MKTAVAALFCGWDERWSCWCFPVQLAGPSRLPEVACEVLVT